MSTYLNSGCKAKTDGHPPREQYVVSFSDFWGLRCFVKLLAPRTLSFDWPMASSV
jgi:hypothetical protein